MFFTKMEGLGNDYIYIDAGRFPIANPSALSVRLSDRHFGIGGDGIILIGTSKVADFSMRIFNADGSEGLMCGNGARCVGKYVYDKHLTSQTDIALETLSGIKMLHLNIGEDGMVASVAVEMGCYSLTDAPDEMTVDSRTFQGMGVSMGNPHYVTFQDDADTLDLYKYGPVIECDPAFPDKTNVEFAKVVSPGVIRMRVWERGTGETLACGTGCCAVGVACVLNKKTGNRVLVDVLGGQLEIEWDEADNNVWMTGPARTVFEGSVDTALF